MKNIKKFAVVCALATSLTFGSTAGAGMPCRVLMAQEASGEMPGEASLNKTTATIIKGQSVQLTLRNANGKVKWSSSNKAVVSVSSTGKVKAKKKGTAVVTAKNSGREYRCEVTVEAPKLNKTSISLLEGETYQLKISGTAQTIKWSSSDKTIAKVSNNGKVRGIAAGECTITGKIGKKKYSCYVTVASKDPEPTPAKPTTAPDKTAENDKETLTGQQVYDAIMAMQPEYPEGMAWTNDDSYYWKGGVFSGGMGCAAFAFAMSDAAFGDLPARRHTDYSNIRVGDILRVDNDTHSVIVLEVFDTYVVVAEGNYNSSIHWGRKIDRTELQGEGDYILTRYPE